MKDEVTFEGLKKSENFEILKEQYCLGVLMDFFKVDGKYYFRLSTNQNEILKGPFEDCHGLQEIIYFLMKHISKEAQRSSDRYIRLSECLDEWNL